MMTVDGVPAESTQRTDTSRPHANQPFLLIERKFPEVHRAHVLEEQLFRGPLEDIVKIHVFVPGMASRSSTCVCSIAEKSGSLCSGLELCICSSLDDEEA